LVSEDITPIHVTLVSEVVTDLNIFGEIHETILLKSNIVIKFLMYFCADQAILIKLTTAATTRDE
jgi:hypothetical protein